MKKKGEILIQIPSVTKSQLLHTPRLLATFHKDLREGRKIELWKHLTLRIE